MPDLVPRPHPRVKRHSKPEKAEQCWPETELGPQSLLGKTWETMSDAEKSTLRAICAVGEQECYGYLDCVNFYDNCHGSMGPCHWTMPKEDAKKVGGHPQKVPSGGELCGLEQFHQLVLEKADERDAASPKVPVRRDSAGLPPSPPRKGQQAAVLRDLAEFQPRPVRGSFRWAE